MVKQRNDTYAQKKQSISNVLKFYEEILTAQGYQVIGLFLYGSQNYDMDTKSQKFKRHILENNTHYMDL